jgi:hypothetical protein
VRGGRDGVVLAERLADGVAQRFVVVDDEDPRARSAITVARSADVLQRVLALPLAAGGAGAFGDVGALFAGSDAGWRGVKRIASRRGRPSLGLQS